MRLKDHKRFVIAAQQLIRKGERLGVCDLTAGIYPADFKDTNPEVLLVRDQHYLKLLAKLGLLAVKAGQSELAQEITDLVQSMNKGGVNLY